MVHKRETRALQARAFAEIQKGIHMVDNPTPPDKPHRLKPFLDALAQLVMTARTYPGTRMTADDLGQVQSLYATVQMMAAPLCVTIPTLNAGIWPLNAATTDIVTVKDGEKTIPAPWPGWRMLRQGDWPTCEQWIRELEAVGKAVHRQIEAEAEQPVEQIKEQEPKAIETTSAQASAAEMLLGWADILKALGRKDNKRERRRISNLGKQLDGPIQTRKQGAQPIVRRDKLLEWWNGLESRYGELQRRERDRDATVRESHAYGRDGEVIPEMQGEVKKRRRTKSSPPPDQTSKN